MARRTADGLAAFLALGGVLGIYSWSLWGNPAFGLLADQGYHLWLAEEFDRAWRDGDFPPRWAAGANGGRGSVGFSVCPPWFAFLTACWLRLSLSSVDALGLAVLTVTAGSFGAVYYLSRAWLSRRRSLAAATVVVLLPGVTFLALGRGMFANYAALAWAALLLGAGQRYVFGHQPRRNGALAVTAAAGLVLTHTLTAYLLALLLLAISPLLRKALGWRGIVRATLAAGAAAGLTCWFWLPVAQARSSPQLGYLAASHPYLDSVIGLGGTATGEPGLFRQDWEFLNDVGGYIVMAQSLLGLLLALSLGRRGPQEDRLAASRLPPESNATDSSVSDVLFLRAMPWVVGFAFAAATEPGARLLLQLPRFEWIQFSWRFQLLISLWCGVALASLPCHRKSLLPVGFAAALMVFFGPLASPVGAALPQQRPDLPRVLSSEQFERLRPLERAAYAGNLIELRPNGIDTRYYLPAPFGRAEVIEGAARVEPQILRTSYRRYRVETPTGATVRLVTYHASGWSATLDGRSIEILMESETGLQIVCVPAGDHQLDMEYRVAWRW